MKRADEMAKYHREEITYKKGFIETIKLDLAALKNYASDDSGDDAKPTIDEVSAYQ